MTELEKFEAEKGKMGIQTYTRYCPQIKGNVSIEAGHVNCSNVSANNCVINHYVLCSFADLAKQTEKDREKYNDLLKKHDLYP